VENRVDTPPGQIAGDGTASLNAEVPVARAGRPTAAAALVRAKQREAELKARLERNPPTRSSARLAEKQQVIGAICHLEGGRYCVDSDLQRNLDLQRSNSTRKKGTTNLNNYCLE
jgi:hypothetical protein